MNSSSTLIWSFRNRIQTLLESIETAHSTCPKEVNFCLVDAASSESTIKELRVFANKITDRTIRICESTYRTSLSEAWNLGMMLTDSRYVIFASSDVVFKSYHWFSKIKEGLISSPYVLLNNHAVFGLDKTIIPKIGWFDEEFKPGPHFDCDYMIRASEGGFSVLYVRNENDYVHGDEAAKEVIEKRLNENVQDRLPMNTFENEDYFKSKWSSEWPGWRTAIKEGQRHLPHPPVTISEVTRLISEADPHPGYTKRCLP